MASMSDYLANALLNLMFRNTGGFTTPSQLYWCLVTQLPEQSDTGTTIVEPVGGNYGRVACNPSTTNYTAPASKNLFNNVTVTFPNPTGTWGNIVGVVLCDAGVSGNMWMWNELQPPVQIIAGSAAPSFAAAQLGIRIDN